VAQCVADNGEAGDAVAERDGCGCWGEFEVPVGGRGFWQVGPLRLWVQRSEREWLVSWARDDDPGDGRVVVEVPSDREPPVEGVSSTHFIFRSTPARVQLLPALADRPVIVTPEAPFRLPPQEEVSLSIATPLWLLASLGEPPVVLFDQPVQRPSDTWFGPSTREGELGYAATISARWQGSDLPACGHRAVSLVRIRNWAATPLPVERIRLPAPNMSLFIAADGGLWTEAVEIEHDEEGEMASVKLEPGPPGAAVGARRLRGPRQAMTKDLLVRAFGGLFR